MGKDTGSSGRGKSASSDGFPPPKTGEIARLERGNFNYVLYGDGEVRISDVRTQSFIDPSPAQLAQARTSLNADARLARENTPVPRLAATVTLDGTTFNVTRGSSRISPYTLSTKGGQKIEVIRNPLDPNQYGLTRITSTGRASQLGMFRIEKGRLVKAKRTLK